jgi:hypothetical protein
MSVPWSLDGPGRNLRLRPFGHPCPHRFEHLTLQFLRTATIGCFPNSLAETANPANPYDPNARHKFVRRALTYFAVILYLVTEPRR